MTQAHHQRKPLVMGILNVTPDSFSDGGLFQSRAKAIDHALEMHQAGADIIDVGGESTRPGAAEVSVSEELERVVPVVEALKAQSDVFISVDTSKPEVMEAALRAGADLINDVRALQAPGAIAVVAEAQVPVILMHMQGQPQTMQHAPAYQDVIAEVGDFLLERVKACVAGGIAKDFICIDPGFGFGKTLAHNVTLLARLDALCALGYPVLAGLSRKSMLGTLIGEAEPDARVVASVAGALLAAQKGAAMLRVHDVKPTVDALQVWYATEGLSAIDGHD